jgi:hypothetical protein
MHSCNEIPEWHASFFAMSDEQPVIPEGEIRAELGRILNSPEFRKSRRCRDFLKFVVEETLAGGSQSINERAIGVRVFGRQPSYDTNEDGIVRISASDVRKRLSLYQNGAGQNVAVSIQLPLGSYVPLFAQTPVEPRPGEPPTVDAQSSRRAAPLTPRTRLWAAVGVLLVATVALGAARRWWLKAPTAFDEFWAPLLSNPTPVMVTAAYTPVFLPDPDAHPPFSADAYAVLDDQYVGGGDLIAAARITALLSAAHHPHKIRMGGSTTFEDLRGTPVVLIGYASTQWAQLTGSARFSIDDDAAGIRDNGALTSWVVHRGRTRHADEDYAIVTRAFDQRTHAPLVLVSGCLQYGTEAAANLIATPDLLIDALQGAPAGWPNKNLQLVLRTKVIGNSPATPEIVARHFW